MRPRAEVEAELAAIKAAEAASQTKWIQDLLAPLTSQQHFDLLDYLTAWRKEYPGHRPDCNCGECD